MACTGAFLAWAYLPAEYLCALGIKQYPSRWVKDPWCSCPLQPTGHSGVQSLCCCTTARQPTCCVFMRREWAVSLPAWACTAVAFAFWLYQGYALLHRGAPAQQSSLDDVFAAPPAASICWTRRLATRRARPHLCCQRLPGTSLWAQLHEGRTSRVEGPGPFAAAQGA